VFCNNFNTDTPQGQRRMLTYLNKIMLRRTYSDRLFNEALVKLPRTAQTLSWVNLNPVERRIYDIVHHRILERINTLVETNKLQQSYSHIFAMLLRLRQMATHILLVEQCMRDLLTPSDISRIQKVADSFGTDAQDVQQQSTLVSLRKLLKRREKWTKGTADDPSVQLVIDEQAMADKDKFDRKTLNPGMSYGLSYHFTKVLDELRKKSRVEEFREAMRCISCGANPAVEPWLTSCNHIYCFTCLSDLLLSSGATNRTQAECVCGEVGFTSEVYDNMATVDTSAEGTSKTKKSKKDKKKNGSNDDKNKPLYQCMMENNEPPLPSAKLIAIKAQIVSTFSELGKIY